MRVGGLFHTVFGYRSDWKSELVLLCALAVIVFDFMMGFRMRGRPMSDSPNKQAEVQLLEGHYVVSTPSPWSPALSLQSESRIPSGAAGQPESLSLNSQENSEILLENGGGAETEAY